MQSLFLAQVMGLFLLIIAVSMLFKKQRMELLLNELIASPAGIFIIAVITLIIGILLVISHNIWVADWRMVITILSWLTLIAGIIRLFLPEFIVKAAHVVRLNSVYYTACFIWLVLGTYLSYIGFFTIVS